MSSALLDNPSQQLIVVDSKGKETRKVIDRKSAHSTPGIKHLAIQILVFNSKNELILHERPLKKVGGGVLDAPTTHILSGETKEDSCRRCLLNEYGIFQKIPINVLGGYSYEKDYGDGSCENEFCLAAYCTYDGELNPDNSHAPKIIKVAAKQVTKELNADSKKYPIWFKETVEIVAKDKEGKKFFD
ncbi:MAG TPA: NUDIX domain-containing protein [archaeon]|nr:NUDIX domain-containing protein [archaeon]